jgi:imidazolonepropionase-like amidohydrolase
MRNWILPGALVAIAAVSASAAENIAAPNLKDPYPSTYKAPPAPVTAIVGATIFTGAGVRYDTGAIVMADGKIVAVGPDVTPPAGAQVIDGKGKVVTPGIIDVHSHLGDYAMPSVNANDDGNEATSPNTAQVWAEHSVWPQDPAFSRALAGGVTVMQILPGSANLFGGRSVVVKNVWSRTVQGMKFPGAPYGMKMACGENPKRVYGRKGSSPATRMGNFAGYRNAWIQAQVYRDEWDKYEAKKNAKPEPGKKEEENKPPKRDLQLETLVGALRGEILVHMHCYRADEMAQVIDMSKEFGYHVTAFHHAVEAYKVGDLLAKEGICASLWADWWGFKMESLDGIEENIPLVHAAGACAMIHSDDNVGNQRLNQDVAKALAAGRRMGLNISDADAWTWLTLNPAKALKIDDRTGSLAAGKMADVVLWNRDPFSVYARAEKVYVDGALTYDLADLNRQFQSDFELGYVDKGRAP